MAGFRVSVIFAISATVVLFAGDQTVVKGGMQLRSRINVQPGFESSVTAPPNILDTTTTEYAFGRTISRHAIALQVHVGNSSQQYDLLQFAEISSRWHLLDIIEETAIDVNNYRVDGPKIESA